MVERRRERERRERAEAIALEAARTLGRDGCFRFRVEDVARRSGVAKGSVYLAFSDKRDLIRAALSEVRASLQRSLEERLSEVDDPGDRLRTALEHLARLRADRPEFQVLLDGRLGCSAAWIGAQTPAIDAIASRLEQLVREARDAGSIPVTVDPRAASRLLMAIERTAAWREGALGPGEILRRASLDATGLASLWPAEA